MTEDLEKIRIEKEMKKIQLMSTYGMCNDRVNSKVLEIKDRLEKMNENNLIALKSIERDLTKKIKQLKDKRKKKEDFKITINGDEYYSENEIIDAYGGDIISSTQKDTALKKFNEWKKGVIDEVLEYQIRYYEKQLYEIHQEILGVVEND